MKKITLIITSLLFVLVLNAQQIQRNLTVMEIATGTWCYYCPGAAMGAEDLFDEFGDEIAILEYHNGDDYTTSVTNSRNSYNQVGGIPDSRFDGKNPTVGGDHTVSLYSDFLPIYNNAISQLTSFEISTEVITTNDIDFDVVITVTKVADYADNNLVAHLAITESNIQENWQGQTELHWVVRDMYPTVSGTTLDFSGGSVQTINLSFVADSEWDIENCEIVAFIQDNDTKDILNGAKQTLNIPIGENNALLYTIDYPTDTITCGNTISPVITVKNKGITDLTSFDVEYYVNDESIATYSWTGSLAYSEKETIYLDPITFEVLTDNVLNVNITNPNNTTDDDISNNSGTFEFEKSTETTTHMILDLVTGVWGFEVTWNFQDADGNIMYSGGGEDINQSFYFTNLDECIYFNIYDSYGNGFNSDDGYYELKDSYGQIVKYTDGNFGSEQSVSFIPATLVSLEENNNNTISVYPNPAKNLININLGENQDVSIKIYNITGKQIFENSYKNINNTNINCSDFENGIYFLEINNGYSVISKKITVIK